MKVLVHLGYPRTGTTYLQKNIFPLHKQINLLGPCNYHNINDIKITHGDLNFISRNNNENDLANKIINKIDKNFIEYFDNKKVKRYFL